MTFPKDRAAQELYLQALETRIDAVVKRSDPFVLSKAGKEPNQKNWEDAWVADGESLPIPTDKLLYWYDPEAGIVRGIYGSINDTIAYMYKEYDHIGGDWNEGGQEGVSRAGRAYRWDIQPGYANVYWEDDYHLRAKASKYDYDTNTNTTDRDIRIYMDGTIEEVGAWAESFETIAQQTATEYADDTIAIDLDTSMNIDIYTAPSTTPTIVAARDFTEANFSATGDASGTTILTNSLAAASSGWLNYASMNTSRGFFIAEFTVDIDATDGQCQFYWGCSSIPASVGGANGYELVVDRVTQQIDLYFNTTLLKSMSYTITAATLSFYLVYDANNDRVTLFLNSTSPPTFIFNYFDTNRTLPGTNIGFGGYKAGADTGDVVISAKVGAMPQAERLRIADASVVEVILYDFTCYVRYNHNTTTWTLINYDQAVPTDYISNPDYDAWLALQDERDPANFPMGVFQRLWDNQQKTGFQITEDSVSSFSFRRYPYFQWLDDLIDGGGQLYIRIPAPAGGKCVYEGDSFGASFFVATDTVHGSTGKIYRLNEWTDGKSDLYLVEAFQADGVAYQHTFDLTALDIPEDYGCLMLRIGNNQGAAQNMRIEFNGDSGANYWTMHYRVATAAAEVVTNNAANNYIDFEHSHLRTTETDPNETEVYIYQWDDNTVYKNVFIPMRYIRARFLAAAGGTWRNTNAITSIKINASTTPTPFDPAFYIELVAVRTKGRHWREGALDDYNMA